MTETRPDLERGISAVIPVYNAADSLDALVARLGPVLERIGQPFEVILVNDGSHDGSWDRIAHHARRLPWLRGIKLMRNYGQHNALLCGIRAARHETIVTLDDDLQNPPEEIPRLLEKLGEGFDVVYGTSDQLNHAFGHVLASKVLKLALAVALGARTARIVSPLRVFRTRLRNAFDHMHAPWVIIDIYLTWATSKFASINVVHERRAFGSTTYTFRRRFVQALDLITGFSTLPLKIASWIGFVFTLFGIGILTYVVVIWTIFGGTGTGFAFLASTIAIFSGAQLFALGILGEYLARMFQQTMGRPPYAISETTNGDIPD